MHTQGKWVVANSGGKVQLGGMQHPKTICILETIPLKISPEIQANAQLISAAPELLRACKKLVEISTDLWGDYTDNHPRIMDRFERAIQKAEGK